MGQLETASGVGGGQVQIQEFMLRGGVHSIWANGLGTVYKTCLHHKDPMNYRKVLSSPRSIFFKGCVLSAPPPECALCDF